MKGIWGRKEKMEDGTELYVNRAYFVRSVKAPMDQIVEGYPVGMLQIELSDAEIDSLLHYAASLK
jgi:cytochrome c oxidase subunit 2